MRQLAAKGQVKVKPQDNAGQRLSDLGGLGWLCKLGCASLAGAPCNSLVSYSSAICLALSLPAVLL